MTCSGFVLGQEAFVFGSRKIGRLVETMPPELPAALRYRIEIHGGVGPKSSATRLRNQWQTLRRGCFPGLAVHYFMTRSEVNSLLEIGPAGELFGLAQFGGKVGHLDRAIADGRAPKWSRTCRISSRRH